MKTIKIIILFVLLIFSLTINGQNKRTLSTKVLVEISDNFGLDSSLHLVSRFPIYYLDSLSTIELILDIPENKPTESITNFLTDYALNFNNDELREIIYYYYSKKIELVRECSPSELFGFSNISDNELLAIIKHSDTRTEGLLISYYNAWFEKSKKYKTDFDNAYKEKQPLNREGKMTPFISCNRNCYNILIALKNLNSNFSDSNKFNLHKPFLEEYETYEVLYQKNNYKDFNTYNLIDSIELEQIFCSLQFVDFLKYDKLKSLLAEYDETKCWNYFLYNDLVGYLDIGCQFAPLYGHGRMLRLELKGNKLYVFEIYSWLS